MELAVISDLHLGIGDITDQFGHDDYQFCKFLQYLESNFDKIILLGDIYEGLMPKSFNNFNIKDCISSHKEITNRFIKNKKYNYIYGNHDFMVKSILKSSEELYLTDNNQNLLFIHGHQYDSFIQNNKIISELGVWLGGWIIRLGFEPMYKIFAMIENIYGCDGLNQIKSKFEELAINSAHKRDADIIITGHTHNAGKSEHGSKLYLNSGSCSEGQISFLSIDTKKGNYNINYSW